MENNYEKLMYSILKKYGLYNKREDYIDICYIGYAKALKKYDSEKSKEITFFYRCIENELLQHLRKENAKKRQREESSLDFIYDDKGHDLEDLIDGGIDIEDDLIKKEEKMDLCAIIKTLSAREQYIIKHSFGFDCCEMTQEEIGKQLNITQTQVSRLKKEILLKIKEILDER